MAQLLILLLALGQLLGLGAHMSSLAAHLAQPPTPALNRYVILPTPVGNPPGPDLTAPSALAIDAASGQVLYSKQPDKPVPIASITKMFTILVVLRDHSLDEIVTVPALPSYQPGAVLLGAPTGAKFKLGDLVKAALIPSDNDAADVLAIHDAGSTTAFVAKMNQLARDWGMSHAHFVSTNGLVDTDNYATARDLSIAARLLITNQTAKALTATQSATISDLSGRSYSLASTNELLRVPGFYGIKTGYTPAAGQCLVARANIHGHDVISVVLGSSDRFGETKALISAIGQGYTWQ